LTPPAHALSGALAGTLAAYAWPGEPERRLPLVAWVTVGAIAPDLDAISLLFDHRVYFGLAWYSHRGFLHSIAGCALMALLLPALFGALRRRLAGAGPRPPSSRGGARLAVFAGGLIHLAGDLPTPPGPWAGLPLLFPLSPRFGGWSHLGWVNALLLLLMGTAALAAGALAAARHLAPRALRPWLRAGVLGVTGLALAAVVWFATVSRYRDFDQWRRWQARFVPLVWIDAVHDLGRPAAVLWDREVIRLR
jgi:membrane-bound metal-dependent hydrolase YbcI (DUF457 family)